MTPSSTWSTGSMGEWTSCPTPPNGEQAVVYGLVVANQALLH
jgi:hypothetical protein